MLTPFRGLVFDAEKVPAPGAATSPPYDVIDEPARRRYLAASPYNVVRLLLAEADDPGYVRAAALLRSWRESGALPRDPTPQLYLYEMDYLDDHGTEHRAVGVVGALVVEEPGRRVFGHEETMPRTRADRMAVLEATRANLDPIVALSPSPELAALLCPQGAPRLDFAADGVRHRLYDVADPDRIKAITDAVDAHPVAIADGHHRYTTAVAFQARQAGPGPWDGIMAFLAPAEGSGLRIDAVHRGFERVDPVAVGALEADFSVSPGAGAAPGSGEVVLRLGTAHDADPLLLRPRAGGLGSLPGPWREAGSAVARELLYPLLGLDEADAAYIADIGAGIAWLAANPKGALVEVAPVSEHAVVVASEMGLRFPQKTTYFAPKPRAGLVLRTFE